MHRCMDEWKQQRDTKEQNEKPITCDWCLITGD